MLLDWIRSRGFMTGLNSLYIKPLWTRWALKILFFELETTCGPFPLSWLSIHLMESVALLISSCIIVLILFQNCIVSLISSLFFEPETTYGPFSLPWLSIHLMESVVSLIQQSYHSTYTLSNLHSLTYFEKLTHMISFFRNNHLIWFIFNQLKSTWMLTFQEN